MTIYLLCECGKKLKARREHAGRKVMCSRCQRVWRLGGGRGETTLALEPLPLTEPPVADTLSLVDDRETSRWKDLAPWLLGLLLVIAFFLLVALIQRWLPLDTEPDAETAPPSNLRQIGITGHNTHSLVGPTEAKKNEPEGSPEPGEADAPTATATESPGEPATPKPQTDEEARPPSAPAIESIEPAEPKPGESVTIMLRDKVPEGDRLEYRLGKDQPWQPALEQRIKTIAPKDGPLTLEVRAVDPKGKPSPVLQRTIPVKSALPYLSRLKVGDVLWQEVVVARVSSFRLLGQDVAQNTQYSFLSRFTVGKQNADGCFVVEQKVEQARMDKADPLLKELLGDGLDKMKGLSFRIMLSPTHEILKFEGAANAPQVFGGGNPLQAQSFLVWSFLDQDGWKELAQLSFFLPERELKPGEQWKRKIAHAWGPLGSWQGSVIYVAGRKQQDRHRIDYTLHLAYQPPAPGGTTNLPFKVQKADFKPQAAAGSLAFDLTHHLVAVAEERFHVRGQLNLSLLGSDVSLEMDEDQRFVVRLHQQKPRGW